MGLIIMQNGHLLAFKNFKKKKVCSCLKDKANTLRLRESQKHIEIQRYHLYI